VAAVAFGDVKLANYLRRIPGGEHAGRKFALNDRIGGYDGMVSNFAARQDYYSAA
jgi:hypothetical protein